MRARCILSCLFAAGAGVSAKYIPTVPLVAVPPVAPLPIPSGPAAQQVLGARAGPGAAPVAKSMPNQALRGQVQRVVEAPAAGTTRSGDWKQAESKLTDIFTTASSATAARNAEVSQPTVAEAALSPIGTRKSPDGAFSNHWFGAWTLFFSALLFSAFGAATAANILKRIGSSGRGAPSEPLVEMTSVKPSTAIMNEGAIVATAAVKAMFNQPKFAMAALAGEKTFAKMPPSVKPGVVTGKALMDLLNYAKENEFAIPGVNIVGTSSINACMEAAAKAGGPIMVTFSKGGGQFIAGKAADNAADAASIAGAVAGALHVRTVAKLYGVPVILHTDHCQKSWLPWFDGLLEANEEYHAKNGEPLFSSHMLDLSEEPLEENIEICKKYLERMAKVDLLLEMELGITGGEEDGVDNSDVDSSKLYTQPEEVWQVYEALSSVPGGNFTVAAAFGNVHGVYAPGNVSLKPVILHNTQKFIKEKLGCDSDKPVSFVFHGGSGSSKEDIQYAIKAGVIKMNIDTDTQWAFWDGVNEYQKKNKDYLQAQIGSPDGPEKPNKKYYDPRMALRSGEESMAERLVQAMQDLNCIDRL